MHLLMTAAKSKRLRNAQPASHLPSLSVKAARPRSRRCPSSAWPFRVECAVPINSRRLHALCSEAHRARAVLERLRPRRPVAAAVAVALVLMLLDVAGGENPEFIYFQF